MGNVAPETAKPLPATVSELIVNAAVPDEVNVNVLVETVFTVTLPKLRELALSVTAGAAVVVPVPISKTVAVLPVEESLEIVIAPVTVPTAAGSKVTFKVSDSPGFSVAGKVPPAIAKPLPETVTESTVSAAFPAEVRVRILIALLFNDTLPKSRWSALTVSTGPALSIPMPPSATVVELPLAELLEMVMVPLAAPSISGSKLTLSVADWPGSNVIGNDAPEIAKPAPMTLAEFTVNAAVPDDVSVSVLVDMVFTVTLPKSKLSSLTVSCGLGDAVPIPARAIFIVPLLDESDEIVIAPLATATDVGAKLT